MLRCPKCGKVGFLTKRWVGYSYPPKTHFDLIDILKETRIKQTKEPNNSELYVVRQRLEELLRRGEPYGPIATKWMCEQFSKDNSKFRAKSGKYRHFYIGHYDSSTYREQMKKYRGGTIKSRPNGRKWCQVSWRSLSSALLSEALRLFWLKRVVNYSTIDILVGRR